MPTTGPQDPRETTIRAFALASHRWMEVTDHVSEIRSKVRSLTDLPPVSMVAQRLLTMLTDEDVEVDDVARVIEMDPGLSARVIGLACSAYFGSPHPIYTVKDAIIKVLGLNMVKGLAVSLAVSGGFEVGRCSAFDIGRYWTSAMLTADMAMRLAPALSAAKVAPAERPTPETAYLSGLLHNLGLMVLTHLFPEPMARIFSTVESQAGGELVAREREQMGVDHHETGSWLAHRWQLPTEVVIVIAHHHEPGYREDAWPACLLAGLCARWVQSRLDGSEGPADTAVLATLGIAHDRVNGAWARCEEQLEGLRELARSLAGAT
jgi:HD-like signal output (HDOD) protein